MINEDTLKQIETLHRLKQEGVITEEDFEKSKAKILHGQPQPRPASPSMAQLQANDALSWMLLPLKRYADFEGRSSRKEFWMFLLFTNLVSAGLLILSAAGLGDVGVGLLALGLVGVLIPFLAVQVRRFHDQGKSGWFALLNLIPYIGPVIVLIFMVIDGTAGDNEYGADPKAGDGSARAGITA